MNWISSKDSMPESEAPVFIKLNTGVRIVGRYWKKYDKWKDYCGVDIGWYSKDTSVLLWAPITWPEE
jgi:hypothetical protein